MYENIGKTIQSVGCILGWLLSIAGGIAWLYFLGNDEAVTGWICFAVGLSGFFSTFFYYAFGQHVDDVHTIREQAENSDQH